MTMKIDKIKHVSLFIVLLVLFSTTATAFTLFDDDDFNPPYGITACDTDDVLSHADETPHAEVPVPFCLCLAPLQVMVPPHHPDAVTPIKAIPFLNHISRAPPLYFS